MVAVGSVLRLRQVSKFQQDTKNGTTAGITSGAAGGVRRVHRCIKSRSACLGLDRPLFMLQRPPPARPPIILLLTVSMVHADYYR